MYLYLNKKVHRRGERRRRREARERDEGERQRREAKERDKGEKQRK